MGLFIAIQSVPSTLSDNECFPTGDIEHYPPYRKIQLLLLLTVPERQM